jgi:hypothetical protein
MNSLGLYGKLVAFNKNVKWGIVEVSIAGCIKKKKIKVSKNFGHWRRYIFRDDDSPVSMILGLRLQDCHSYASHRCFGLNSICLLHILMDNLRQTACMISSVQILALEGSFQTGVLFQGVRCFFIIMSVLSLLRPHIQIIKVFIILEHN